MERTACGALKCRQQFLRRTKIGKAVREIDRAVAIGEARHPAIRKGIRTGWRSCRSTLVRGVRCGRNRRAQRPRGADQKTEKPKVIELEPMTGIEPATYGLRNRCSTTELHWRPSIYELLPLVTSLSPKGVIPRERVRRLKTLDDNTSFQLRKSVVALSPGRTRKF
jgi:hypothetical protein